MNVFNCECIRKSDIIYSISIVDMNTLSVYLSEYHKRTTTWWVVFSCIIIVLWTLALFWPVIAHWWDWKIISRQNLSSFVVIALIVIWYIIRTQKYDQQSDIMIIWVDQLTISHKVYSRNLLEWFVIEADANTWTLKNIVLITKWKHEIYSIKETDEDTIILFIESLKKKTPRLLSFHQSPLEIVLRRCKL